MSGYLGSVVGLDPSETGAHGPWLLKVSKDGALDLEQIPIAPLRWEHVRVPVDGIEHVEDVPDRLLVEAERRVRQLHEAGASPRALGLRVQLTGTSTRHQEIRQWVAAGDWNAMVRVVDGTAVFFNKIVDSMGLSLDLSKIAEGNDPAALLAQRLLILQHDDDRSRTLLEKARSKLSSVSREDKWSPVQDHRNATDPPVGRCLARHPIFGPGRRP